MNVFPVFVLLTRIEFWDWAFCTSSIWYGRASTGWRRSRLSSVGGVAAANSASRYRSRCFPADGE